MDFYFDSATDETLENAGTWFPMGIPDGTNANTGSVIAIRREAYNVGSSLATEAGIVDQQMQRTAGDQETLDAGAHRGEIGQVELEPVRARPPGQLQDLVERRLGARQRTGRQENIGAPARELARGDAADAGVRSGDQGHPAGQVLCNRQIHGVILSTQHDRPMPRPESGPAAGV